MHYDKDIEELADKLEIVGTAVIILCTVAIIFLLITNIVRLFI